MCELIRTGEIPSSASVRKTVRDLPSPPCEPKTNSPTLIPRANSRTWCARSSWRCSRAVSVGSSATTWAVSDKSDVTKVNAVASFMSFLSFKPFVV